MTKAVADFEVFYDIRFDAYRIAHCGQDREDARVLTADELRSFLTIARGEPVFELREGLNGHG